MWGEKRKKKIYSLASFSIDQRVFQKSINCHTLEFNSSVPPGCLCVSLPCGHCKKQGACRIAGNEAMYGSTYIRVCIKLKWDKWILGDMQWYKRGIYNKCANFAKYGQWKPLQDTFCILLIQFHYSSNFYYFLVQQNVPASLCIYSVTDLEWAISLGSSSVFGEVWVPVILLLLGCHCF